MLNNRISPKNQTAGIFNIEIKLKREKNSAYREIQFREDEGWIWITMKTFCSSPR